jgi:hypothetical protein
MNVTVFIYEESPGDWSRALVRDPEPVRASGFLERGAEP